MTRHLLPIALLGTLTGCAGMIGNATASLSSNRIIPEVMRGSDVAAGCAAGEAFGSMVSSFADASKKADIASIIPIMSAGMCFEEPLREAELSRLRALRQSNGEQALDLREVEKRLHFQAAQRYYAAFDRMGTIWGLPETPEECPKLKKDSDQLTWMLGTTAGTLASLHNKGAGNSAGVPADLTSTIPRVAECLDNDAWWGVPLASQAAIWTLHPAGPPSGEDPWAIFDRAIQTGLASGMYLPIAFAVQTAESTGNEERVRHYIGEWTKAQSQPSNPDWAMLNTYGQTIVLHASDKIWTQETGSRTPFGALGTFPGAAVDDSLDDLLDGEL